MALFFLFTNMKYELEFNADVINIKINNTYNYLIWNLQLNKKNLFIVKSMVGCFLYNNKNNGQGMHIP
jgi:hypothetical protein